MSSGDINIMEINAIKECLLEQKSDILNKSLEFKQEQMCQVQVCDESEIASQDIHNNISINLLERNRHSLMMIEIALGKIVAGTYGCCESCDDQIGLRRLKARPFTTLCIACMEEREDSLKGYQ
ncbi:MAG: TraR/DksA family transcriptional regulator [Bdellovibrionota bacterium]